MARPKNIITTGFPEVDRMLATLSTRLQKKAIKKGTRAGAKIVLAVARQLVPHEDGVLEDTLNVRTAGKRTGRKLRRGELGHTVIHIEKTSEEHIKGVTRESDPFYGMFVEYGHDGWEGDPYIRPALYSSRTQVISALAAEIKKEIERIRVTK